MGAAPDGAPRHFRTAAAFRTWLRANHATAEALVVRIAKTHAAASGITYAQALDEALCVGWIDGVRRSLDADSFSIRFSPRKRGSIWSLVNVRHVERLVAEKRMRPEGLRVFEARDPERTGIYAFEQGDVELAPAYLKRLRANKAAWAWFSAQAPWYRRTSSHWVMRAKREETRERRLATLIECSAEGRRIGPLARP